MSLDHEGLRQLPLGKDLNKLSFTSNKAFVHQELGRNGFCRFQISQAFQVNDRVFGSKLIRKPVLGYSTNQWHLTALKAGTLSAP
jgi:hypothetical protein